MAKYLNKGVDKIMSAKNPALNTLAEAMIAVYLNAAWGYLVDTFECYRKTLSLYEQLKKDIPEEYKRYVESLIKDLGPTAVEYLGSRDNAIAKLLFNRYLAPRF